MGILLYLGQELLMLMLVESERWAYFMGVNLKEQKSNDSQLSGGLVESSSGLSGQKTCQRVSETYYMHWQFIFNILDPLGFGPETLCGCHTLFLPSVGCIEKGWEAFSYRGYVRNVGAIHIYVKSSVFCSVLAGALMQYSQMGEVLNHTEILERVSWMWFIAFYL
jgi:hypothetical protein